MAHIHPDDNALIERWFDGQQARVDACDLCRARTDEIGRWIEAVRSAADDEADAAFPPERLAHQRSRILRRLAEMVGDGRPARVLTFPVRDFAVARFSRWTPRRLVATAAAAGLVAGIMAGTLFDLTSPPLTPDLEVAAVTMPADEHLIEDPQFVPSEEAFLTELENALDGSSVEELRALDGFTPSVREASLVLP
jgi:anti-sigma factor RsiW